MLSAGTGSFDEFSAFYDTLERDGSADADVDALGLDGFEHSSGSAAPAPDAALARDIITGEVLGRDMLTGEALGRDIRLDPVNSFARWLGEDSAR